MVLTVLMFSLIFSSTSFANVNSKEVRNVVVDARHVYHRWAPTIAGRGAEATAAVLARELAKGYQRFVQVLVDGHEMDKALWTPEFFSVATEDKLKVSSGEPIDLWIVPVTDPHLLMDSPHVPRDALKNSRLVKVLLPLVNPLDPGVSHQVRVGMPHINVPLGNGFMSVGSYVVSIKPIMDTLYPKKFWNDQPLDFLRHARSAEDYLNDLRVAEKLVQEIVEIAEKARERLGIGPSSENPLEKVLNNGHSQTEGALIQLDRVYFQVIGQHIHHCQSLLRTSEGSSRRGPQFLRRAPPPVAPKRSDPD